MIKKTAVIVSATTLIFQMQIHAFETISLEGEWEVKLDPTDVGIKETWQKMTFEERIQLPGSLPENGFGDDPNVDSPWTGMVKRGEWSKPQYAPYKTGKNFKMPFWLQPKKIYVGAAWYRKDIKIPRSWGGKHLILYLERPHWETKVWVDDKEVSNE